MSFIESMLPADLSPGQLVRWIVLSGLVALAITLLVLMRTRWGHSQPLRKCIALSLLAHLLIGVYATTVEIVTAASPPRDTPPLKVAMYDPTPGDSRAADNRALNPWDDFAEPVAPEIVLPEMQPQSKPDTAPDSMPERQAVAPLPPPSAPALPPREPAEPAAPKIEPQRVKIDSPAAKIEERAGPSRDVPGKLEAEPSTTAASKDDATPAQVDPPEPGGEEAPLVAIEDASSSTQAMRGKPDTAVRPDRLAPPSIEPLHESSTRPEPAAAASSDAVGPSQIARAGGDASERHLPSIYQLRVSPDHERVAQSHGGSKQTEAAVVAALKWLSANQSADGRWDARRLGGGREVMVNGQDRGGAGSQADTGVSGLSLLALLASGHTHLEGEHRDEVRRGLEFLLRSQAGDGNLAGSGTTYERMYCHAMAAFALSEAFAMTADERLRTPVTRAVNYSVAAQHRASGGWRYSPGEPGDTSQLGWQLMALKSAELAGIKMPPDTRAGIIRYLKSVSSGTQGGLASYRPGHRASRAMTAEALVCRQFLGMARDNPAGNEAATYIISELPGQGEANVYYWYYATLGLYQLQGPQWERWNKALQTSLLSSQRSEGELAGSWDPDAVWGANGGRAYSTALSALCLEVYYRYLPLYIEAGGRK